MVDERTKEELRKLSAEQDASYRESLNRAEIQTQISNMSLIEKAVQREEMIKQLNENARQTLERDRQRAQEYVNANQFTSPIDKTLNLSSKIVKEDPIDYDLLRSNLMYPGDKDPSKIVVKKNETNTWPMIYPR